MPTYRIAPNCSIMSAKTNDILLPKDIITPEMQKFHGFTPKIIEEHLKSKYLKPYTVAIDPEQLKEELYATPPGVTSDAVVKIKPDTSIETSAGPSRVRSASGPKDTDPPVMNLVESGQPVQPVQPVATTPGMPASSVWILNPATLQGKPLAELNVMISERNADVGVATSIEQAVSYLSQDFVLPTVSN